MRHLVIEIQYCFNPYSKILPDKLIQRLGWELAWHWQQEWQLELSSKKKCFTITAGTMDITMDDIMDTTTEDTNKV